MNFVEITHSQLDLGQVYNKVVSPSCGAVATFVGTTRDHFEDKHVMRLEYDAYISMAEKQMQNICTQIRKKWTVKNIALIHRLGAVKIGEASVIIAICSEHRQDSLAATSYAIDTLKATVPIWKKEIYDDGQEASWKENKECSWSRVNENNETT